jgi:two-component system sensor histidine kinase YesM
MTAALMRLVSAAFRGDDSLASFAEELELLEQYLLIMRVRYGDTFGVAIDVPEAIHGCRIPRMMLQPLVENAILHGLQGLKRRGEIVIRGRIEEGPAAQRVVVLEVSDNGRGMDAGRLADALGGPGAGHRGVTAVGLANIRRRIALNQCDGCGLCVESAPDRGTVARLRLPVIGEG